MIDMTTGQQHYEMMHNENKIVWPKSKSKFHAHKFYNTSMSIARVLTCFFEGGLAENIIHFMLNIRQTMQMTYAWNCTGDIEKVTIMLLNKRMLCFVQNKVYPRA